MYDVAGIRIKTVRRRENVESVRKGVITLEQRDTKYDATTGQPIGGGSLGLTCSICVTPADIAAAEKYIAEND